jgi:riboflavin kinase/FMN adenylyltransferase
MRELSVDVLVVLKFDRRLQAMEADRFLEEIVFQRLKPAEIIFGHDHRFGAGRGGSEKTLERFCRRHGVRTWRMPAFKCEGQIVSSTLIRELITMGKVKAAAGLLGHPYLICGRVVRGCRRGRKLGFPTANVETGIGKLLMPDGVYRGTAFGRGREIPALISLGTRPTFGKNGRALEAHLAGYKGNLYGKRLCLGVAGYLRPQKRFKDAEQLKKMMREDIGQLNSSE